MVSWPYLAPSLIDLLDTEDTENDEGQQECEDAEPYPEEAMEIYYDDLLMDADAARMTLRVRLSYNCHLSLSVIGTCR